MFSVEYLIGANPRVFIPGIKKVRDGEILRICVPYRFKREDLMLEKCQNSSVMIVFEKQSDVDVALRVATEIHNATKFCRPYSINFTLQNDDELNVSIWQYKAENGREMNRWVIDGLWLNKRGNNGNR